MNGDIRSELLSAQEVAWLADGGDGLSPHSPLSPFAGLGEGIDGAFLAERRLTGPPWERVVGVMRRPTTCVRVAVPGPSASLVQYFVGDGRSDDGLIGCWIEGDGLRVSFPWALRDVVSLTSQALFSTPPGSSDIPPVILTPDGLVALGAAIDAIRSRFHASMAERKSAVDYSLDDASLERWAGEGAASTDARWMVPMLGLTRFIGPTPEGAVARGVEELVAAGLLDRDEDALHPGGLLFTFAGWWMNLLPTVSYETERFEGDMVARHEHRLVIRGDGPLCVLHRAGVGPVSIGTVSPLEYFDEMTRAFARVTSNEPEYVYVIEPVGVRDGQRTTTVAGYLQPGRWYVAEREAGAWARISDPSGPLEGWAPGAALYRRVDAPAVEVPEVQPDGEPPEPVWEPSHLVPSGGLTSWAVPDGRTEPIAGLAAGVELQVTESLSDWAHVRARNGWEGWVDGRRLTTAGSGVPRQALTKPAPRRRAPASQQPAPRQPAPRQPALDGVGSRRKADRVALAAGVSMIVSVFLPWSGIGRDAADISALYILTYGAKSSGWPPAATVVMLLGLIGLASVLMPRLRRLRPFVGGFAAAFGAMHLLLEGQDAYDWYQEIGLTIGALFTDWLALGAMVLVAAGIVLIVRR